MFATEQVPILFPLFPLSLLFFPLLCYFPSWLAGSGVWAVHLRKQSDIKKKKVWGFNSYAVLLPVSQWSQNCSFIKCKEDSFTEAFIKWVMFGKGWAMGLLFGQKYVDIWSSYILWHTCWCGHIVRAWDCVLRTIFTHCLLSHKALTMPRGGKNSHKHNNHGVWSTVGERIFKQSFQILKQQIWPINPTAQTHAYHSGVRHHVSIHSLL